MANHIVTDTNTAIKDTAGEDKFAERIRALIRFMAGCNRMLHSQIKSGLVELRLGSDGHVRLVEGSQA